MNPFFNANLYLAKNPDLAAAGLQTPAQLWAHYVAYGAQESLTAANRAPNSWFDASFYLTNNPDLGAAGITAGMALDHYYHYGVHEARLFNPNPALAPNNFSANTYAQQNPDLVAAFGIVNPANPSAAERGVLEQHFLSYGYSEGRPGVNATFANLVEAEHIINLTAASFTNNIAYGTVADDSFIAGIALAGNTINGLGGNDAITFAGGSSTGTGATAVKLQNIEKVIAANGGAVEFLSNQLLDVQINAGMGSVNARFDAAVVAGQNDSLNVTSTDVTTDFTTHGIENLHMNLGNTVNSVVANANNAKGANLLVELSNGAAAGVGVTVDSAGSTALTQLTVDGSELTGGFSSLALGASLGALQNLTVYGGAGSDALVATSAIDTFVGGGGNDTFNMGTVADTTVKVAGGTISAMDTITDFTNGDQVLGITAAAIVTGTGAVPTNATLEQLVTGTAGTLADGDVFGVGNDTYILVNQDATLANVSLVKLTGVDVADLQITGGTTVEFA